MIINEIYIDGFGIFNDYSLTGLKVGVNIIEGKNEAGKSTLLDFIRQIFFGQGRNDYKHEPLNGGRHGGRIIVSLANGHQVTFERFFGRGGLIRITENGNNFTDSAVWQQSLGKATKSLHSNVYAFTLDELIDIKNLNDSGMEDKLNSVSMGLGDISFGELEGHFRNLADNIYTSRGRVQKIPSILSEINELRNKLREFQDGLLNYNQTIKAIDVIEKQNLEIKLDLDLKEKDKRKFERYINCFKTVIELTKLDEEIEKSPEIYDCPEDGLAMLEQFENEENLYQNSLTELKENPSENGINQLKNKISSIQIDEQLLGKKDQVDYLKSNLEVYKKTLKANDETQIKIDDLNKKITSHCFKINPVWTRNTVREFSKSIIHKDAIKQFEDKSTFLREKKIKAEARYEASSGKPTDFSDYFKIAAIICILLAVGLYFLFIPISIALLLIAIVLFFGNSFMPKTKIKESTNEEGQIEIELEEVRKQLNIYLETNLLINKNLSFETIYEVLSNIEKTQEQISEEEKLLSDQQNELKPFIQSFELKASEIVPHLNLNESVEVQLKNLFLNFENQQNLLLEKQKIIDLLANKELQEKTNTQKLNTSLQKINDLLFTSNCTDRLSFRKKYTNEKESRGLREKRKNLLMTIEQITGVEEATNTISFLKTQQIQELQENLSNLEQQILDLKEKFQASTEELGKLKKTKETLMGESHISETETEIETCKQSLTNAYKEWLSNRITTKILSDVKKKYENEKQPDIIKKASDLFYHLTGQKYHLNISLYDKQITVVDDSAAIKHLDELSRGTKEQLLICLRLGYINEYEKTSEPLPLVLDDIMVNFDSDRAKEIAGILSNFSVNRQVLILTCHPLISSYFTDKTLITLNE